jgi:hypothetical protein
LLESKVNWATDAELLSLVLRLDSVKPEENVIINKSDNVLGWLIGTEQGSMQQLPSPSKQVKDTKK